MTILSHPAFWGFCGGFFFFVLSFFSHWKTKREFRRFQKHLGDKLELEAKQYEQVRAEKEAIAKENENLRIRISQLNERPDQRVNRELETLVRAEKRMIVNAPGFAPAWETAKSEAAHDMEEEEKGKSIPKRILSRFFTNSNKSSSSRPMLGSGDENEPSPKDSSST